MRNKLRKKCFRLYKMPMKRELFFNKMAESNWEIEHVGMLGFLYTFRRKSVKDYYYKIFYRNNEELPLLKKYKQNGAEFKCKVGRFECFRLKRQYVSHLDNKRELNIETACSYLVGIVVFPGIFAGIFDQSHNEGLDIFVKSAARLVFLILAGLFIYDGIRLSMLVPEEDTENMDGEK